MCFTPASQVVSCDLQYLTCAWTGERAQLGLFLVSACIHVFVLLSAEHLQHCAFAPFRGLFDRVLGELKTAKNDIRRMKKEHDKRLQLLVCVASCVCV